MKRIKILIAAAAGLALAGGGTALAAVTAPGPVDGGGAVHGCWTTQALNGSHVFLLQDAGTACPKGTTPISWNQTGPTGPSGPAGAPGAIGPVGPAGPAGAGVASVDDLDGATCRVGTPQDGIARISYSADGTISLTCVASKLFTLTVVTGNTLTGTVAATPGSLTCTAGTCTGTYPAGTQVSLSADQGAWSTFSGWSGDCSGSAACTLTMSADHAVTATFVPRANVSLTVQNESNALFPLGTNTVTYPGGGSCATIGNGASHACTLVSVVAGQPLTFTVDPNSANHVDNWSGCTPSADLHTCTLTPAQGFNGVQVWFRF